MSRGLRPIRRVAAARRVAPLRRRRGGGGRAAAPAPAAVSAPGIWERKPGDTRDNPYLFLKSPTVIIGANDPIVIPRGRVQIDFECEFATVIGKPAKYVPVDKAADYIFGYTAHMTSRIAAAAATARWAARTG